MGQIIEEITEDFTLGMAGDPRDPRKGFARAIANFDIFSQIRRMVPYPDAESGDNASSTSQKQNFGLGFWTPTSVWRLFALGVISGTGKAEILMKDLGVGGGSDLADSSWLTPLDNQSSTGSTSFALFVYYKTVGKFFGAKSGTTIWSFTPNGSTAFGDSEHSLAYSSVGQGLVHSKDDCLYIPYDNKIARNNNGSWTDAALTVPSSYIIKDICEFGNYLAVAIAPLAGVGRSRVYLWDRDTSLATISESLDFGEGNITVIEELYGQLIGISLAAIVIGPRLRQRVIMRSSDGTASGQIFKQLIAERGTNMGVGPTKQKVDNRIYFSMFLTIDAVQRSGMWSIGISSSNTYALTLEHTTNNDLVPVNPATLGFILVGDFALLSYIDNSGNYALAKTNDASQGIGGFANQTAYYETVIKNGGDSDLKKKLLGGALMFEPLPDGASVSLSVRKDNETGWKRIFHYNATGVEDGAISKGGVRIANDDPEWQYALTITIATPGVFSIVDAFTSAQRHGLQPNQVVYLTTTGALPTGLAVGTPYYVLASGITATTFKLSATLGGAAINTTGAQNGVHTLVRDANLPEGKEFIFRLESFGGAVLTGFKYKMEVLDKQLF